MRPIVAVRLLAATLAAATACAAGARPTSAPAALSASTPWFPTWSPSQSPATPQMRPGAGMRDPIPSYANATLRQIVHTSIGGDRVRIHISNEYGDRPLVVGSAHIALSSGGGSTRPGTDHVITFGGRTSATVRAGAVLVSDGIAFDVPATGDVVVSLYLPDSARTSTRHPLAVQTTYIAFGGDQSAATSFHADTTMRSWIFLSGVDVANSRATGTIIAVGNSITDGYGATPDSNRRWPDVLARRLLASGEPTKAVVNAGISGNRVLTFGAGPSLVSRFDRDVLMQPGVTHVIILEGINDISRSNVDTVTAEDIISGLGDVVRRAHERGIVVYGATLTPFGRARPENEAKRQAVNQWIRSSGVYDGVIDFDAVIRDPSQPNRMLPAYDSGDQLHPSDAGYAAMGDAIDLSLFRRRRLPT